MDLNRNQFFLAGLIVLLLGIQFRVVDTFVLNPKFAKMIAKKQNRPVATASFSLQTLLPPAKTPAPARKVHPPDWVGYSLLSIGAVLILHSMAMRRPDGGG